MQNDGKSAIRVPRQKWLRGWQDMPESRQNAAKRGRQKDNCYRFTTFGEIKLGIWIRVGSEYIGVKIAIFAFNLAIWLEHGQIELLFGYAHDTI